MSPREETAKQIDGMVREPPPDQPAEPLNRYSLGYAAGWNAATREAAAIIRGQRS